MKIGCLLSVREKSKRLPKKVLLEVGGKPLTSMLLQRLGMCQEIDKVILSTSTHENDTILVDLAHQLGVDSFRGSKDDKLQRYYDTAIKFGLDAIVIVDGDDLFCFPEMIDEVAKKLREMSVDCVYTKGLPLGAAAIGLKTPALQKVLLLKDETDTEVWGGYFIGSKYFDSFEYVITDSLLNHPEIRLTLDYEEDYQLIKAVEKAFAPRWNFSSYELMDLLINQNPEIAKINLQAQLKYEQHLNKSAPVRFKKNLIEEGQQ
jgi:spore coat polysaccharide biosynthesis protein SpsF